MNRKLRTRRAPLTTCLGVCLAAGMATPTWAVDKSWTCGFGDWSEANCWTPLGRPLAGDRVFIGNLAGVHNSYVNMDRNETTAGLSITDGMTLENEGFILFVNGDTTVSGNNLVGDVRYRSRLRLTNAAPGADFQTDSLTFSDRGTLDIDNATILAHETVTIGETCWIDGDGIIQLAGGGTSFVNNGSISPGIGTGITLTQLGDGAFDLDGSTGNGELALTIVSSVSLSVNGDRLSDPFSGSIRLAGGAHLHMNLAQGWTADSLSAIDVYGAAGFGHARITGTEFTFGGELTTLGSDTQLTVEGDAILQESARAVIGVEDLVAFVGETTILGGDYSLAEDAELRFMGPTEVRGGTFTTFSSLVNDGSVIFEGATEYRGDIEVNGVARQIGDATVPGASVITAEVFDMDGSGPTLWTVSNSFVVNAGSIDTAGNDFSDTIAIGGGFLGRLVINLDDPDQSWAMSGAMSLTGDATLFVTRVGGSPLLVSGNLTLVSGKANISSSMVTFANSSDIHLPAAGSILRLTEESLVFPSATFHGDGTLQNSSTGDMTIMSGASTSGVGLVNQGALRISSSSGIASVDTFQNTATGVWHVQVGGYAAGTDYDRLIVSGGGAALAGTVEVEVIDDGVGDPFRPNVGDTFTVLTAVGGVTGSFQTEAVSQINGYTYEWSVISNPNDVTLRLEGVTPPPCSPDFNNDGVVNSQDFFDFLTRFFSGSPLADFNHDGVLNSQDFFDFLTVFFGGC